MVIEEGESVVNKMEADGGRSPQSGTLDESGDDQSESSMISNGLLISYKNDQLNYCAHDAIKKMSRVKYKCMDVYREYLAFGTSSGGIYLFRLDTYEQSSCNLTAMIPSDAGSVEVIKFLPNLETQDLLIAIGTARGSLVIFRLTRLTRDQEPFCNEIYKAEAFTANSAIRSIDVDQNYLVDPNYKLEGIYICDTSNRIYILHYNSIVRSSRRTNSKHQPTLLLGVNDSKINQISIYRQILLISTIENSRLFYEHNCQLFTVGTIKRKVGSYGACFYNPPPNLGTSNTIGMSTNSLSSESQEPFMCFIARPNFRLWHVNHERRVLFTHKFEPYLAGRYAQPIELNNVICANHLEEDDPREMVSRLTATRSDDGREVISPSVDHFEKLLPIYTKTLGNLLLGYSKKEILVLNPIEADLVVWMQVDEDECIMQIACFENELFVWTNKSISSNATTPNNYDRFRVRRYILLAPTQMVLELHRMQRHYSLMAFVQLYARQFKDLMAIPLSNQNTIITTEGGLLRNVMLSSWQATIDSSESGPNPSLMEFKIFAKIIEQILNESRQLKDSFLDLASSRLYLLTSKENIERLYSEPYTSLITLQVSIASLHTEHVIHFDQETIDHHKQMNLSQTLLTLQESKQRLALSQNQLQQVEPQAASLQERFQQQKNNNKTKKHQLDALHRSVSQNCVFMNGSTGPLIDMSKLESNSAASRRGRNRVMPENARVIVERRAPQKKQSNNHNHKNFNLECQNEESLNNIEDGEPMNRYPLSLARPYFSPKEAEERQLRTLNGDRVDGNSLFAPSSSYNQIRSSPYNQDSFATNKSQHFTSPFDLDKQRKLDDARRLAKLMEDSLRCSNCQWPRERVHCNSLNSSQMIQLRWIESNLLDNFVGNLEEIEQRSFKHGLWNLYLRCLIEKNDYETYITCCMMLDDVRLLDYERLQAKTESMDRDLCNRILKIMSSKLEAKQKFLSASTSTTTTSTKNPSQKTPSTSDPSPGFQVQTMYCLNCESSYEQHRTTEEQNSINDLYDELELNHQMDDEFSFNLVNLFEQVLINRFNDLQVIIQLLLDYTNLVSNSKIPSSFYLKVIATATLVAKQSPSNKARLSKFRRQRP